MSPMEKLDLKKVRKELFAAPLNRFEAIEVPRVSYLMADGHGERMRRNCCESPVEN